MWQKNDSTVPDLEGMTHSQRVKRMYELGKLSLIDGRKAADAKAAIDKMWQGDFHARYMAIVSCHGSRDGKRVIEATTDKSQIIRRYALHMVPLACDDEQVLSVLSSLNEKQQRELLKKLRYHRRFALVDRLVETLFQTAPPLKLSNVIFFASAKIVAENLNKVSDVLHPETMRRFTYQHPSLALDFLSDYTRSKNLDDFRLVNLASSAMHRLPEFQPDGTLELIAQLQKVIPLYRVGLNKVFRYRLAEAIDLLGRTGELRSFSFYGFLHKCSDESLNTLLQANAVHERNIGSMAKYRPSARQKLYEHFSEAWRAKTGTISTSVIDYIDEPSRIREAKRNMAHPSVAANLRDKLAYARYLDWDEAIQILRPVIDSSEVENRVVGFEALMPILRFRRGRTKDLLAIVIQRKNESDPVRLEMLSGLAKLPPSIWKSDDLPLLTTIINDALSAADLSHVSLAWIGQLLMRVFRFHPAWAGEVVGKLVRERGPRAFTGTGNIYSRAELRTLAAQFLPSIKYWEDREYYGFISDLGFWYGKKIDEFPSIVNALCSVAKVPKAEVSFAAANVLKNSQPKRFNELLPMLLKSDESWGVKPIAYEFMHQHRQDLLTPYLGQKAFKGQFSTGKTRIVPNITSGFHRWTSKQQTIFCKELQLMALAKDSDYSSRTYGMLRACLLPEPPVDTLKKIIDAIPSDNNAKAARDFVLMHIGTLDGGQGLPILLDCLADDRARLAIYSLRQAVLGMPPMLSYDTLINIPDNKVTVLKEKVRLIGELRIQDSFNWLLSLSHRELHKDVRVALLRALWNYPDKPETWAVLEESVDTGNDSLINTAMRMPVHVLDSQGRSRLLNLMCKALRATDPVVRTRVLNCILNVPIRDTENKLAEPLLQCLASNTRDEATVAAQAFLARFVKTDQQAIRQAVSKLIAVPRSLIIFLTEFQSKLHSDALKLEKDSKAILDELHPHPTTAFLQLDLAFRALPWAHVYELLQDFDKRELLHADAMTAIQSALESSILRPDLAELEWLEDKLSKSKSGSIRRIGLSILIALAHSPEGWTGARFERLCKYRADESLMVSSAAIFTLPQIELESVTA